jgi:hypothetical protein
MLPLSIYADLITRPKDVRAPEITVTVRIFIDEVEIRSAIRFIPQSWLSTTVRRGCPGPLQSDPVSLSWPADGADRPPALTIS